ncbi:protein grindelwald isoform X1 [Drosophila willistoni]|uniref:protein grindelwald isoform X1 n=1 Tax=Drosophila willistoni TaxID=7260 RepID=UPI001F08540C|nr:protein grindelwald isoform X1 [Drosophila willistoni]
MSNGKDMRPLSLSIGASLLPSFSLVTATSDSNGATGKLCNGKTCHPVEEYCSVFAENCQPCASICDANSHNYHAETCSSECPAYNKYETLKEEIHDIHSNQRIILLMLSIILVLIAIRYLIKCLCWLRRKRCVQQMLQKLQSKSYPHQTNVNGKDLNATTIQNLNAINRHGSDIERAPSQIYSVAEFLYRQAGPADGSVMTMTTPVSTRYPAENSTTPTTVVTEIGYGYDNQAMVVTPVSEKPSVTATTGPAF